MSNTNKHEFWQATEFGKGITTKKYYHDGETSFADMSERISSCFSPNLKHFIEESLYSANFFPGGRSLYALGCKGKFKATTSNCFVLPTPLDNVDSIFNVGKEIAVISSKGGGCGVSLSKLRPRGAKVNNVARTSTGAVSFMELYNTIGSIISQNGRRGALLISLDCSHPDIEEFLSVKQDNTSIQAANISINFTDEFMKAVEDNAEYELYFKVESTGEEIKRKISARDFFMKFCEMNKEWAEPGAIFIDRVRNWNLMTGDKDYIIDTCNPCGEFFAKEYNSCNLGSINIYNLVVNPFTKDARIDGIKLKNVVTNAVFALDEILDYGYDLQPLDENREDILNYRSIGLGVFGFADALIALGITYGSDKAVEFSEHLFREIFSHAAMASSKLAEEKGTFLKYDKQKMLNSPIIQMLHPEVISHIEEFGLRNSNLLSIAPTGSISTMCGLSGGVEALFQVSYRRTTHTLVNEGKYFDVYAKSVEALLLHNNISPSDITITEIKEKFPFVVDAHDITPLQRVSMQSAIQKYVDNAISSTVNMKKGSTVEDVFNVYMEAWKRGCKGVTVFVDGCMRTSILSGENSSPTIEEKEVGEKEVKFDTIVPIKREEVTDVSEGLKGKSYRGSTACVPKLYTQVNEVNGNVFEVFTNTSQGCTSNINTITRLTSLALRSGVKVTEIVKELKGSKCAACHSVKKNGGKVSDSCGTCIGEALEKYYNEIKQKPSDIKNEVFVKKEVVKEEPSDLLPCPECNAKTLRPEGKCFTCSNCGYSKCD